ncbi:MAG: Xaa-Pro peptidase family protein [Akkermansiaceae bacterium]|jgi:Xaa-Pro aminopeptidase
MTTVLAGMASQNATLFHRIRFKVSDSSVIIDFRDGSSTYLVRDIEMERARQTVRADHVGCSADFTPEGGLSGDRDTALAQATAECLRRAGESEVLVDRTLPYLYAHFIQEAGIAVHYSGEFGVMERRIKDEVEIEHLRKAQQVTGEAMTFACNTIASADADREGFLMWEGAQLTSERLRAMITADLIDRSFSNAHDSIVVTAPHVADCHHYGTGPLKTGLPVIVDIFPMDNATRYNGDMTRTVVHGTPSDEALKMHAAVAEAKKAGCEALRPGTTGEAVHRTTIAVIEEHGFEIVRGDTPLDAVTPYMSHGTGHGIGLEVHEPILLDHGGGEIFQNELFTVEPALYSSIPGGVRIEDMVLVTEDGHEVMSPIHEGLDWRG